MYLLLVCCKRWLPHPQLHRVVGLSCLKLLTLLFSDFVEHMCHKVLVNCCLVAPATVFPGSNACFSGLVIFLNAENLRAAFIIAFIFSQSNSYYETYRPTKSTKQLVRNFLFPQKRTGVHTTMRPAQMSVCIRCGGDVK